MKRLLNQVLLLCLMGLLCLGYSSCQFLPKAEDANKEAANQEESGEEEEHPPAPIVVEPQPVLPNYRPVKVKAPDGVKLYGLIYVPGLAPLPKKVEGAAGEEPIVEEPEEAPPSEEPAEAAADKSAEKAPKVALPKVRYPLIILCHMLSDDRWEWQDFPKQLVEAGYAVLVFDMRGHGESTHRGKNLYVWRQFDKTDWLKMPEDIGVLTQWVGKNKELVAVDTTKVGVIGASIGANVGINYAAAHPKALKTLVLLSPGLDYQGVETAAAMKKVKVPSFFIASQDDNYAAQSTQELYQALSIKKKIQVYEGTAHGSDILGMNPDLGATIIAWLSQALPTSGVAPAAEPPVSKATTEPAKEGVTPAKEPPHAESAKKTSPAPSAKKRVHTKPAVVSKKAASSNKITRKQSVKPLIEPDVAITKTAIPNASKSKSTPTPPPAPPPPPAPKAP